MPVTLFAVFVLTAVARSAASTLSLSLQGPANVGDITDLKLVATITNIGSDALRLLDDPRSLVSTRPVNKFAITDSKGRSPDFTGILVKYSPEMAAKMGAFKTLPPGASVQVVHNLADGYDFSGTGNGAYDFLPDNIFYTVDPDNQISVVRATDQDGTSAPSAFTVSVESNLTAVIRRETNSTRLAKRATFRSCSSDRQQQIQAALEAAKTYASEAKAYLTSNTATTARYSNWFGSFTATRRNTVLSHFTQIDANDFNTYTFDCSCTDGSYAYVQPSSFGVIHFCNAFWNAPNTGTDSKAGTIIHESSHFTRNGGTQDYAYGQPSAKRLGQSDPNKAVMNADSHEYFAENTPRLT